MKKKYYGITFRHVNEAWIPVSAQNKEEATKLSVEKYIKMINQENPKRLIKKIKKYRVVPAWLKHNL